MSTDSELRELSREISFLQELRAEWKLEVDKLNMFRDEIVSCLSEKQKEAARFCGISEIDYAIEAFREQQIRFRQMREL